MPAAGFLLALLLCATPGRLSTSEERLCVLDFHRIGEDGSMDWLARGLSDMLIVALARNSGYQVIEREHLRELLEEHDLTALGLVDPQGGPERAQILNADLLLAGSFALHQGALIVEARLIRVSDQTVLVEASWEGEPGDALAAAPDLCADLLGGMGVARKGDLRSFEGRIPRRIDVAAAYYHGLGELEEGRYPEALSSFLEGADLDEEFLPMHRAAIRAYYFCEESEHAVLFADAVARSLAARGRTGDSLEFAFAAAEHAAIHGGDPSSAIPWLEQMVACSKLHEERTRELERALADEQQRSKVARKLSWGTEEATWWRIQVPESDSGAIAEGEVLAVYQWGIRAQRDLARAYASALRLEESLSSYRDILETFQPLARADDGLLRSCEAIRAEAHFMWLRHFGQTGELHRDHALRDVNALNLVEEGKLFVRDFSALHPDPRARVASRYEERGHEYFDFACAAGLQIDSVSLVGELEGLARFSLHVPDPKGWPPRFAFSRRIEEVRWKDPGTHRLTVRFPPGTQLVSIGTAWGVDPFSDSPADLLRRRALDLPAHRDIDEWSAVFELSPLSSGDARSDPAEHSDADRALIARYARRDGWESASVLRPSTAKSELGFPRPWREEEWKVTALDGDLFVHHRDLALSIELPATINTPGRELEPCLLRTHERSWALLFSRGERQDLQRLVAFSPDGLSWESPRALRFEPLPETLSRNQGPLEGTSGVQRMREGYRMLLQNGFTRLSSDLRNWKEPEALFEGDVWRTCLFQGEQSLWAVCVASSDALVPYGTGDSLAGFFVVDGRRYKHVCELRLAASRDGKTFEERGEILLSGQPTGLWAFAISDAAIGIGVQFNGRFLKWFVPSRSGLEEIPGSVELLSGSEGTEFFAVDQAIWCLRPVFDSFGEQRNVLLRMGSAALFERLGP